VHDLQRAKWSEYADHYEEMLNSYKEFGIEYKNMIQEYKIMISEVKKELGNKEPSTQLNLLSHIEDLQKHSFDIMDKYKETLDEQEDISKQSIEFAKKGGISGFSTLSQIEATKNIALAAVFLAISGVGFSISSIIISIVN
jgi:lysozyme family protein